MCVWGERAGHQTAYRITKEMFSDARGPDFGPKNQAPKKIGHQKNRGSSPEPTSARVHPLKTLMERNTPPVSLRTGSEVESRPTRRRGVSRVSNRVLAAPLLATEWVFHGRPIIRPHTSPGAMPKICQHMSAYGWAMHNGHWTALLHFWKFCLEPMKCALELRTRTNIARPRPTIRDDQSGRESSPVAHSGWEPYVQRVCTHSLCRFFWHFRPTQQHMHDLQM